MLRAGPFCPPGLRGAHLESRRRHGPSCRRQGRYFEVGCDENPDASARVHAGYGLPATNLVTTFGQRHAQRWGQNFSLASEGETWDLSLSLSQDREQSRIPVPATYEAFSVPLEASVEPQEILKGITAFSIVL